MSLKWTSFPGNLISSHNFDALLHDSGSQILTSNSDLFAEIESHISKHKLDRSIWVSNMF